MGTRKKRLAEIVDSLEPPRRGGSNEYPQSMCLSRNETNNVYSCKPQFYYIQVGFNWVNIIQACFRDASSFPTDHSNAVPLLQFFVCAYVVADVAFTFLCHPPPPHRHSKNSGKGTVTPIRPSVRLRPHPPHPPRAILRIVEKALLPLSVRPSVFVRIRR